MLSPLSSLYSLYQKKKKITHHTNSLSKMAVEAKNLNIYSPQILTNTDFMSSNQANAYAYNAQIPSVANFSTAMAENFSPFQQYSLLCDSVQAKNSMKADSGLTCNLPAPRKRSRDSFEQFNDSFRPPPKNNPIEFASFLGEDISFQIQQQQLEIDHIVALHTKKIRMELEERQKQHARQLVSTIGEGILKKLNEKDLHIQRMGKLNLALQEKVKSLCVENQLWRDLAQSNEAAAISLRSNLEQVLAHVSEERFSGGGLAAAADECESCCGSNDVGGDDEVARRRTLAWEDAAVSGGGDRKCRKCGEAEACVLLLPCRHLCVCTMCGSQLLQACPVCHSRMTATVHVNMS